MLSILFFVFFFCWRGEERTVGFCSCSCIENWQENAFSTNQDFSNAALSQRSLIYCCGANTEATLPTLAKLQGMAKMAQAPMLHNKIPLFSCQGSLARLHLFCHECRAEIASSFAVVQNGQPSASANLFVLL